MHVCTLLNLPDTVVHRAAQITVNRQASINDFILTIFEH